MSMRRAPLLVLIACLPLAACSGEPTAAATPTAKPRPAATKAKAPAATTTANGATPDTSASGDSPEAYSYQTGGRRDPFLNILNGGSVDPRATSERGEGAAGLLVNEITVRAIATTSARVVAMIQGPDGRNYNIHAGDKFADGTVKSITREGLVIVQDINDPLSTAKQREVKKLLRSLEDAKQ